MYARCKPVTHLTSRAGFFSGRRCVLLVRRRSPSFPAVLDPGGRITGTSSLAISAFAAPARYLATGVLPLNATSRRVARIFVPVGGALVDEIDLIEFVDMLTVWASALADGANVGCTLAGVPGRPAVAIGTGDAVEHLEMLQARTSEGPGPDASGSGRASIGVDLAATRDRWPRFADGAVSAGFQAAHAFPLRWDDLLIGAVTIYLPACDEALGDRHGGMTQAVVDMASWGLARSQPQDATRVQAAGRLQRALSRRMLIDQATGILAQAQGISIDDAFASLRRSGRLTNRRLSEVAGTIVNRPGAAMTSWPPAG